MSNNGAAMRPVESGLSWGMVRGRVEQEGRGDKASTGRARHEVR